ncbi:phospho-N-acetylmuramoyl-pentapeptide-transferase [Nocardioides sp. Kera G14]|uniref:phospho-N-acetylmuramoyl-pentapeptide- transferase n=1 Tax=Nocardioides sp. Kera G14 TaxID=2884264 RepID=UPI001D12FE76|nr:phospho-N-acetylmuramoyl-pentapeptide-transferase [Nocardioides sp. Kera G14]UDY22490.1 phospho-N-acetylmuramoyl-pentapeptide-transferase [Nocardioides sp. Kera G14]
MRAILLGGGLALLISLLGTRVAIAQFTRLGYGQEIREDGPTTHLSKRGTPTMGGVVIVLATVIAYFAARLATGIGPSASALLLLFLFVGTALVGFLDDFIKIFRQRNLGLRSRAKFIGQTLVAVVFGVLALWDRLADDRGRDPASHNISFLRDWGWTLPSVVVVIIIWFLVTGFSNAVNLTDGLDGLATGASGLVFAAYTIVAIWQSNQSCGRVNTADSKCYLVRDPLDLAVIAACITGACIGFLWWNASPARIFMGDTGSLALGAALAGFAVLSRTELLLVVLGGLFVLETLSVMLQVGFFKVSRMRGGSGRRLFKMAPIHHHFEMLGWEQVTVVIRFWIITGLCVAVGVGIFYGEWVTGS